MEKLQVPENITLRWEIWRGVGKKELIAILLVTAAALIGAVTFCLLSTAESDVLVAVFAVIMIFAAACGVFTKADGQSIFGYICRQMRFKREQQTFRWRVAGKEVCRLVQEEKGQ